MTYPSTCTTSFSIDLDKDDISETEFLKNSIVHHVKYGSTNSNSNSQNFRYITHYVDPNDTLQGLALKYGCKIENIKKCNKLFTDDNNHLRTRITILIPIESKPIVGESSSEDVVSGTSKNGSNYNKKLDSQSKSLSLDNNDVIKPNGKHPLKTKSNSLANHSAATPGQSNGESLADFLVRIDSSIAKTKSQVGRTLKLRDDNGFFEHEISRTNKKFSSPRISPEEGNVLTSSSSQSNLFPFDDIDRIANHNGNTKKKVKSSLKKFEKKHEEIFEL